MNDAVPDLVPLNRDGRPFLTVERYADQRSRWPKTGRHILGHFDETSIIVYQAYNLRIAEFAVKHQRFGGDFSFKRMSWIKPNFLWMMYRSGWGTKADQEVTLAIKIECDGFEEILRNAVHSSFVPEVYSSYDQWDAAVAASPVRMQWDPDHDPAGNKLERRAIQLGLSGDFLATYSREWIREICDISAFVAAQREHVMSRRTNELLTPEERVYIPKDLLNAKRIGVE